MLINKFARQASRPAGAPRGPWADPLAKTPWQIFLQTMFCFFADRWQGGRAGGGESLIGIVNMFLSRKSGATVE